MIHPYLNQFFYYKRFKNYFDQGFPHRSHFEHIISLNFTLWMSGFFNDVSNKVSNLTPINAMKMLLDPLD